MVVVGFNPTFYAGRPKLSEITIDSDLDMGGRKILHAQLGSPHVPETWATEELDWGDVAPSETETHTDVSITSDGTTFTLLTATRGTKVTVKVTRPTTGGSEGFTAVLKINDVDVQSISVLLGETKQFNPVVLNAGDVLTIHAKSSRRDYTSRITIVVMDSGLAMGAKTFDLTGKWLALGLNMQGLAATVKIQGVEMPYSDYAKYFPLAPTELKIPGGWDASQIRPIVEVYV